MTHASLFSGLGGFDLAASWMGWRNAFHCEIDGFCSRVLKYHFSDAEHYTDIRTTDFTEWRGRVDILTGGFPCQPFSLAGRRRGAEDDRYLWPEMLRAIREIQPTWVVGENVAGILTMVQPGEEASVAGEASVFGEDYEETETVQQYVTETVCSDLEREGYSVQPLVIPACAVGAPHRRDRVWFVAYRADAGAETLQCGREDGVHADGIASDTDGFGQRGRTCQQECVRQCEGASDNSDGSEDGAPAHSDEHGHTPRTEGEGTEGRRRGDIPQPSERGDETDRADGLPGLSGTPAHSQCSGRGKVHDEVQPGQPDGKGTYGNGREQNAAHTDSSLSECRMSASEEGRQTEDRRTEPPRCIPDWSSFPTQSPVRQRYDGISNNVVRYIKQEVYDAIKEHIRGEDLSCVWKAFQEKEIREKIGRLYEIPRSDILLEVLQRTSEAGRPEPGQRSLSPFSESTSERVLCYLRKHGTFAGSPLGQKYQEQFRKQFNDTLPKLSHEIALATKKIVEACESTASWVRKESVKAYGNAVVPQVVYEIFRAIEMAEKSFRQ